MLIDWVVLFFYVIEKFIKELRRKYAFQSPLGNINQWWCNLTSLGVNFYLRFSLNCGTMFWTALAPHARITSRKLILNLSIFQNFYSLFISQKNILVNFQFKKITFRNKLRWRTLIKRPSRLLAEEKLWTKLPNWMERAAAAVKILLLLLLLYHRFSNFTFFWRALVLVN